MQSADSDVVDDDVRVTNVNVKHALPLPSQLATFYPTIAIPQNILELRQQKNLQLLFTESPFSRKLIKDNDFNKYL